MKENPEPGFGGAAAGESAADGLLEIPPTEVLPGELEHRRGDRNGTVYSKDGKRLLRQSLYPPQEKIVVRKGTKAICDGAFHNVPELRDVELPDGLLAIGRAAFAACWRLRRLVLPPSLREIKSNPFYMDRDLVLENNSPYLRLENRCLVRGNRLVSVLSTEEAVVKIPACVREIGDDAARWCKDVRWIIMPEVTSIGSFAFYDCTNLCRIRLREGLVSIAEGAFALCPSLRRLELPSTLVEISGNPFEGSRRLELKSLSPRFRVENDLLIDTGRNKIVSALGCHEKAVVPDGITEIGERAFALCEDLVEVKFPVSLRLIDGAAFRGCRQLETVNIPPGVTRIGKNAFRECGNLLEMGLPACLEFVGSGALPGNIGKFHINIFRDTDWESTRRRIAGLVDNMNGRDRDD